MERDGEWPAADTNASFLGEIHSVPITMRPRGISLQQPPGGVVDISSWEADDEFSPYPEGARDKTLLRSPQRPDHQFLIPGHRYLFKRSPLWCPDQFWTEILTFKIGCQLGVTVPRAFVASNSSNGDCGALIEWFFGYEHESDEQYVPGGDYLTSMIDGYDRKRGRQHNLDSIAQIMEQHSVRDWREWWCDTLFFDALIGNTDRHQDNWGLLWRDGQARMAPAFDNGRSLGHEISPDKMRAFADPARVDRYLRKGMHHVRRYADGERPQHAQLLLDVCSSTWGMDDHLTKRVSTFNVDDMRTTIESMERFDIGVPLGSERRGLIHNLTQARHRHLTRILTG
jgi:hypothetical protein